ncbi:MAG: MOSC N-terminal beta barrel domain-containing protein [Gemmatimonadaceae bacterium]
MDGWRAIGRVAGLYRHPVKSMSAQPLADATIDGHGIVGDRRFALRRIGDQGGFPWLTASKLPALITYRAECAGSDAPTLATMRIHSPAGDDFGCESDALARHLAEAHGVNVELLHLDRGIFDVAGLSIITTQTLASLGALLSMPMDARRFRPNIVVDVEESGDPYPEDAWVGRTIAFGNAQNGPLASITELDERCSMINLDPDTGASSPEVMRTVVRERDNRAGVYAVPTRGSTVAVGDRAYIRG